MFKLALDAGHGRYAAGKRCLKSLDPNETREWVLNSRICNKVQEGLTAYEGVEVLRMDDITGETDVSLNERCRKANSYGANYYLSVHHNAGIGGGTGGGFEVYRYIGLSENGETARKQKIIAQQLEAAGVSKGNRSSNIRTANFAVLRDTNMEAALVECAYMDSATDVPILLTEDFANRVAQALINSVVIFGNLTLKAPKIEEQVPPFEEAEKEDIKGEELPEDEDIENLIEDFPSKENVENVTTSFFKLILKTIKETFKKKG